MGLYAVGRAPTLVHRGMSGMSYVKRKGENVRNLVIDLLPLAERASGLTCSGCGISLFGSAAELQLLVHRPRCTLIRARKYLYETA